MSSSTSLHQLQGGGSGYCTQGVGCYLGGLGAALWGLGADMSMPTACGVGYAIQATQPVGFVAQLANWQTKGITSSPTSPVLLSHCRQIFTRALPGKPIKRSLV